LSSRFWSNPPQLPPAQREAMPGVCRIAILAVGVIFVQLVIGAIMRQLGAGLAIPDFPTSYGHWLPPTILDENFRQAAIHQYGDDLGINRVTEFQIWIHFAHRLGAAVVTGVVLWLAIAILRGFRNYGALAWPAIFLLVLLPTQVTLGILTVLMRKPADIASLHVAVGSLVLMTAFVTLMRTMRLRRFAAPRENAWRAAGASAGFPSSAVNA
jgi:cytochrome c oxidase assembly protein subunit 15